MELGLKNKAWQKRQALVPCYDTHTQGNRKAICIQFLKATLS